MKNIVLSIAGILIALQTTGQNKYMTRSGHISFFSEAPLENIEAHNRQSNCIFDMETGEIASTVLMRGFQFEKALMQEHFNENYVESHIYPKASFRGKIIDYENVDFTEGIDNQVSVEGSMEIHGVSKDIKASGSIKMENGNLKLHAVFPVKLADHEIKIPGVVKNNIAEIVEITVEMSLEPFEN